VGAVTRDALAGGRHGCGIGVARAGKPAAANGSQVRGWEAMRVPVARPTYMRARVGQRWLDTPTRATRGMPWAKPECGQLA